MSDKYMVFVPGSSTPPEGPFDVPELEARVRAGSIPDDAKASVVGANDWVPISTLVQAQGPQAEPAPVDRGAAPPHQGARRKPLLVVAGAAVVLLAGAIVAIALTHRPPASKVDKPLQKQKPPPVTAADLHLDFSGAQQVKDPGISMEALGMSWKKFRATWHAVAGKHHVADSWKRGRIGNIWVQQETTAPGVEASVFGIGRDMVTGVRIAANTKKATAQNVFTAIEILRKVAEPKLAARKLYGGLGLLAPATVTRKFLETDRRWKLEFQPISKVLGVEVRGVAHPDLGKGHAFTLEIANGQVDNWAFAGFDVSYMPATKGKTFQQAAAICQKAGLELCTSTQWSRACREFNALGSMQSWTASYTPDFSALQTRGGAAGCDGTGSSHAADSAPERVGLCCNASAVWPADTDQQLPGVMLLPVVEFQEALDARDPNRLRTVFGPQLVRYYTVEDVPREKAVKLSVDYMKKNPDFWGVTEHCSFGDEGFLAIRCLRNVFNGPKGEAVQSEYALSKDYSRLVYIRAPKVFRRMSPL